jgi:hypothetical protein
MSATSIILISISILMISRVLYNKFSVKSLKINADKEIADLIENGTIRLLTSGERLIYTNLGLYSYYSKGKVHSFNSKILAAQYYKDKYIE